MHTSWFGDDEVGKGCFELIFTSMREVWSSSDKGKMKKGRVSGKWKVIMLVVCRYGTRRGLG